MKDSIRKVLQEIKKNRIYPFGSYEWRILDIQKGKALLLSEYVLEKRVYHKDYVDITWENSTLRKYLNIEFYNKFSSEEKAQIAETKVINNSNPWFGTYGCSNTMDKIFLLSIEEVVRYFGYSNKDHPNNLLGGWGLNDNFNTNRITKTFWGKNHSWWLRSPGLLSNTAALVDEHGYLFILGRNVYIANLGGAGVRPALWLKL